jgi:hypothetical protein
MRHFFHLLSEFSSRNGPFGALLSDFEDFEPTEMRKEELASARNYYQDEERCFEPAPPDGELRSWAHELYRYQLVIFSNFLTTPSLVQRLREQITAAFRQQRLRGVVVVMGGIGDPYPDIYEDVDMIARTSGHLRVKGIPEVINDSSRQPHFARLKQLANAVWNHLTRIDETANYERKSYPRYWDPGAHIKSLQSFALRVYRKAHTARPAV